MDEAKLVPNPAALNALTLTVSPIGFVRTSMDLKFDAPHQPDTRLQESSVIELVCGLGLDRAVIDLAGFERIWLVWWFHKNSNWRPMVLPPRGGNKRRGVFATRSPHRPNPIGITSVPLLSVQGLRLIIGSNDLIDGTPILDIKPYISEIDAFSGMRNGWLAEVESLVSAPPQYTVHFSELVSEQISWLAERWKIDFVKRAVTSLERDPTPHRTRRISKQRNGSFRMGCGAWRLYFTVDATKVSLLHLAPGYPARLLNDLGVDEVPHREAQLAFAKIWGD